MVRYKTLTAMMAAVQRGEIPTKVVSPGYAAALLGISRQALDQRLERGTLRSWRSDEGYVLIDSEQVRQKAKEKRGIAPGQGELYAPTS